MTFISYWWTNSFILEVTWVIWASRVEGVARGPKTPGESWELSCYSKELSRTSSAELHIWFPAFRQDDRMISGKADVYFSLSISSNYFHLTSTPKNTAEQLSLEPPVTHVSTKQQDFVLNPLDFVQQHVTLLTSSFLKYSFLGSKWPKTHIFFFHTNCSISFSSQDHPLDKFQILEFPQKLVLGLFLFSVCASCLLALLDSPSMAC